MMKMTTNKPSRKTGQLMGFPNRHERVRPKVKGKTPTLWNWGRESLSQSLQRVPITISSVE